MKGIEISERYYREYGIPMLEEKFGEYSHVIAVGLVGSGSECFGYDDEISKDHDFEPGFCIFIPDETLINSKVEFALARAYAKLPKEYMGLTRADISPVGGTRHGVIRISDFYIQKIGTPNGDISFENWLNIPEYSLAEAVNGKIFRDDLGLFSSIRNKLLQMPFDVKLKKIAGNLLLMAQAGQYNYMRCLSRGETGAAQLAAFEFVESTMKVIFLLNDKYMPYYKWSFKALRELSLFGTLGDALEYIISSDNTTENSKLKYDMIEDISLLIIEELKRRGISEAICGDLEKHAYSVNDKISDISLRNLNIFAGI